jgi:hypothetical protein
VRILQREEASAPDLEVERAIDAILLGTETLGEMIGHAGWRLRPDRSLNL